MMSYNNNKQKMSKAQEILNKLDKLKSQASQAPDFLSLQKVAQKISKIKGKLTEFSNHREFKFIIQKIEELITQKNKYFQQKMIKKAQITSNDDLHNHPNRTLTHCKSAQDFKAISKKTNDTQTLNGISTMDQTVSQSTRQFYRTSNHHSFNKPDQIHQNITLNIKQCHPTKQDENQSEFSINSNARQSESQSQIHTEKNQKLAKEKQRTSNSKTPPNSNHHRLHSQKTQYYKKPTLLTSEGKQQLQNDGLSFQQKLLYSFKQIEDLSNRVSKLQHFSKQKQKQPCQRQSPQSPMSKNFFMKQQQIVDYYKQQLNDKNSIIFDLQQKLSTFKATNDQLKNLIIKEQHRNQNYIEDLKTEIKNLQKHVDKYKQENQSLNTSIQQLENKNDGLMSQIKKLLQKLSEEVAEKQKVKKSIINAASIRTQQLQHQIHNLSAQSISIQKLQIRLQQQQQQKEHISQYKQKLQIRIDQLEQQSQKYHTERDQIQLQVFKLQEQLKQLKGQLKFSKQNKQTITEQLHQTKSKLKQQQMATNLLQYENQLKNTNKLNKLKQIKGLLTNFK